MLLLDVDGVLTCGDIIYTAAGDEVKRFSVKDGMGIRLLMDAGIEVGIVTARRSPALMARLANLGITRIYDGVKHKEDILDAIVRETGLTPQAIAYAGDDLPDIRIMKRCGLPMAVADACAETRAAAVYVTQARGGAGAVREISERMLRAQGLWDDVIERFL
jgi:3-deoxy-D-manno-octulosonate 8-phosphate phosphatase (KDO 8-P phosphatase)